MITLDDLIYDLSVREFAYNTFLYGADFGKPVKIDPTDANALSVWRAQQKSWNPNYYPYFYRDIWPILLRSCGFASRQKMRFRCGTPARNSRQKKLFVWHLIWRKRMKRWRRFIATTNSIGRK